ncbi:MAG: methionine adenosyltransferase, partial [Archaeoglobaceae archaeon]
ESLVLNVERRIYEELRKKEKAIGEDVKVMGLRIGDKIHLTLAVAMVDKYLNNMKDYDAVKTEIANFVKDIANEYTRKNLEVAVNTADDYERGAVYLTVTGTSAENGDDGSVGRGNRVNGLITPSRPMSLEASSGKNPINHVGKIYNLLANLIANRCYEEVDGIREVYVKILSRIGYPINDPLALSIQVLPKERSQFDVIERRAREIAEEMLGNITKITQLVIENKLRTF